MILRTCYSLVGNLTVSTVYVSYYNDPKSQIIQITHALMVELIANR